jgi:hypothetical protein
MLRQGARYVLKRLGVLAALAALSSQLVGQTVVISGQTKDCGPEGELLVPGLGVKAFDPASNHHLIDVLGRLDTLDIMDRTQNALSNSAYGELKNLWVTAPALRLDSTSPTGKFSLIVPSMDSVLVLAFAELEDRPDYYQSKMVGARANVSVLLDMSGGGCGFTPPPKTVVIRGHAKDCFVPGAEQGVPQLDIRAFDPRSNVKLVAVLQSLDTLVKSFERDDSAGVSRWNSSYTELESLLRSSTPLARDSTSSTGSFSLTVPSSETVLLLGFGEQEDETSYYQYRIVGALANVSVVLDMSRGACDRRR